MSAITWRNIEAPDIRGVSTMLAQANQTLNSGFSALDNVLKQRAEIEEANWKQGAENNTNAIKNLLYGAKTPEEMATLQQSGRIQEMLQQAGAQVNQDQIHTLMDSRPAALQQRALQENAYQQAQEENRWRPVKETVQMLAASEDPEERKKAGIILGAYGDLPGRGELMQKILQANQAATTYAQQQDLAPLEKQKLQGAIQLQGAQVESLTANAKESLAKARAAEAQAAAEAAKTDPKLAKLDAKDREAKMAFINKNHLFGAGQLDSPVGMQLVQKAIEGNKRLQQHSGGKEVMTAVDELLTEAKKSGTPIPVAWVTAAIAGADTGTFTNAGSSVKSFVKERLKGNHETLAKSYKEYTASIADLTSGDYVSSRGPVAEGATPSSPAAVPPNVTVAPPAVAPGAEPKRRISLSDLSTVPAAIKESVFNNNNRIRTKAAWENPVFPPVDAEGKPIYVGQDPLWIASQRRLYEEENRKLLQRSVNNK